MVNRLILFFLAAIVPGLSATTANPMVMGSSQVSIWARADFLHSMNPSVELSTALNYSMLYEEEAGLEGVNPDLAFAQMMLETSFLRYGGQVRPGQNNFAGLGALDGGDQGLVFNSPRLGIRAQVQHLKFYASEAPLILAPINPRLMYVRRASAPSAWLLGGSWASDVNYGKKLMALLERMVDHAERIPGRAARSLAPNLAQSPVSGDGPSAARSSSGIP